ncbi:MAG: DUF2157 domain-containing protein [Acidobacteriota bacterium]
MNWDDHLDRWARAGLIDPATVEKIRAFEALQPDVRRVRWPVAVALAFGGVLLGAGLFLFVQAHWDTLSPIARIGVVILGLAVLHVGGALSVKFAALSTTLHAVGTVALGGAIFIAGQVFNMDVHWPDGLLLWALGAWAGVWLRRDVPQLVMAAILTPAWIAAEASPTQQSLPPSAPFLSGFIVMTALAYISAARPSEQVLWRRTLSAIGTVALLPYAAITFGISAAALRDPLPWSNVWLLLLPVLLAFTLRAKFQSWPVAVFAAWLAVVLLAGSKNMTLLSYLLAGAGSVGCAAWGIAELRRERVNLGVIGFMTTVLVFYASHFIDSINRSLGLIGMGLLFLAGGWQLERLRRRLMRRIEQGAA